MAKDRLIVKNFGPIKEVDINLSKVTVFIGEQASGKSVLAKLATLLSNPTVYETQYVRDWIIPLLEGFNIKTFLVDDSYASFENEKFTFGIDKKRGFKTFKDERLKALNQELNDILKNEEQNEYYPFLEDPSEQQTRDYFATKDYLSAALTIVNVKFKTLFSQSVYVPTERNLISILSKSLFNLLKNDVELPSFVKAFGSLFESARKIIKETDIHILNLKYSFSENSDRITLANGNQIDLIESSSGIQSIIPLVVVIDAVPKRGSHLFIVEEPELNLYPTTQKALIEYLIEKCTHGDNRLIITTHSPYILTALNNCIQAKNVVNMHPESAGEVEKLVPSKYQLDYQDVAAFYVGGGTAEPIMNEESQMIDANAIDDVSEQLGSIFDQLLDLKYQNQD